MLRRLLLRSHMLKDRSSRQDGIALRGSRHTRRRSWPARHQSASSRQQSLVRGLTGTLSQGQPVTPEQPPPSPRPPAVSGRCHSGDILRVYGTSAGGKRSAGTGSIVPIQIATKWRLNPLRMPTSRLVNHPRAWSGESSRCRPRPSPASGCIPRPVAGGRRALMSLQGETIRFAI
jgi:hypothetical protein